MILLDPIAEAITLVCLIEQILEVETTLLERDVPTMAQALRLTRII